jgi:predicted nucleic acid-binding protein
VTSALLDTSTLIAGMLTDHQHHAEAAAWLAAAKAGRYELVVSGHSLAETYSVLTRLPRTPKITPAEAKQLLDANVTSVAKIVSLSGSENVALLDEMVSRNVVGGMVYDAIIARAAELVGVDRLITINEKHFLAVWPGGAARVRSPLTNGPP